MKKVILISLIMFLRLESMAQTICHTPQISTGELTRNHVFINRTTNNNSYFLNVFFHVIRKSDGTGGHTYQDVNDTFTMLNTDFNSHNIYFFWDNVIDYIDDSSKFYVPSSSIFTYNNHQNGIDVYLYPDDVIANYAGGLANGVGVSSELYVGGKYWKSPYPSLIPSHVVSHEMGHVLGLWHTHHGTFYEGGSDSNQCAELVDGSNSDTCGDYIEDTPADPHLHFNVNPTTFQWLGSGQDANGDTYIPDTRLIMSYTDIRCMSYFSALQGERMRNAIENLPSINSCLVNLTLSGSVVLCNSNSYFITNLPIGATVSWSLVGGNTSSVSLQSDSPSTNQCTLTLTNPSGFNTVTLQADVIMNGVTVKSLQEVISKAVPFSGTYEETSILYNGSFTPSIPLTAIPGSRDMDVYVGGLVKVESDYFIGKSISISGPYTNYYRSGSLVRFTLSTWSGAPVVITVQAEGCDDEVRLKFFPAIMLDDYSLNISPAGNGTYTLSLIRKTEDGVLPETSSAADDCAAPRLFSKPWTLEVTNALTSRKAFSKEVAEPTFLLHTDGWEAGVYVVRALVGDESLAGKITVK